jgi:hypothetical protein
MITVEARGLVFLVVISDLQTIATAHNLVLWKFKVNSTNLQQR